MTAVSSCGPTVEPDLQRLLDAWPDRWAATFGALPIVVPRIVLMTAAAGSLRAAREQLGRSIGILKTLAPEPGPRGALIRMDQ